MTLVQLEYFISIAETGSFRKTAELMYVSQPAVSKQISQLEKEWNIRLFDRSYRVATLTPAGKHIYQQLISSRREFVACLKDARLIDRQVTTSLCVGMLERVNLSNLLDIFVEFQKTHPSVNLTVEQIPLDQLHIDTPDSRYDLVITHDSAIPDNAGLEIRELVKARRMVILSRENPILQNRRLCLADLNHQRFYVPGNVSETASVNWMIRFCSAQGFDEIGYTIVPNLDSVITSVQMNFGVGIVDETVILPKDGSIVALPFGECFSIVLAWHRGNNNPAIPVLTREILSGLKYTLPADGPESPVSVLV